MTDGGLSCGHISFEGDSLRDHTVGRVEGMDS